uniref:non-specific serine/threonine protein kinase n=1 Tax=Oryza glumipatula TaxID=40148 RepID=A0A0D9ZF92_9ORYZ
MAKILYITQTGTRRRLHFPRYRHRPPPDFLTRGSGGATAHRRTSTARPIRIRAAGARAELEHRRSLAHMTMTAPRQEDSRIDGNIVGLRSYSFQELDLATNGFGEELGKGAYGMVFKGVVADTNQDIAVKRLEKMAEDGQREFNREVRVIARTHHRNLLRLLGFCNEGIHRLLVYEYMPNGSLANLLFHSDASPAWSKRVAIALDVARGLQYLHSEIEGPIIHCDIKPENILIDSLGIAKIADFGLAKLLIGNQTKTFTGIRGTRGYLAPEWSKNRAITVKADVYSYGIMLLEVISCKKSMDLKRAGEEYNISEWAYECVMFGDAGKVADGVDEAELVRMVNVGIWCTQSEPAMRPAMKSVALMIEGAIEKNDEVCLKRCKVQQGSSVYHQFKYMSLHHGTP